jgi:hypothetical protein
MSDVLVGCEICGNWTALERYTGRCESTICKWARERGLLRDKTKPVVVEVEHHCSVCRGTGYARRTHHYDGPSGEVLDSLDRTWPCTCPLGLKIVALRALRNEYDAAWNQQLQLPINGGEVVELRDDTPLWQVAG